MNQRSITLTAVVIFFFLALSFSFYLLPDSSHSHGPHVQRLSDLGVRAKAPSKGAAPVAIPQPGGEGDLGVEDRNAHAEGVQVVLDEVQVQPEFAQDTSSTSTDQTSSTRNSAPQDASPIMATTAPTSDKTGITHPPPSPLKYNVHTFYYSWYGNPKVNGRYWHWNHEVLKHWNDKSTAPPKVHEPPDDIGATFYPELGPYSSFDPEVIAKHMEYVQQMGVGTICLSWWGQHGSDQQLAGDAGFSDRTVKLVMDIAARYAIKCNFHLEPYPQRSAHSVRNDIDYILTQYGSHPAFYRDEVHHLPVFYAYDSYLIKDSDWREILAPTGSGTIRGTKLDSIVLGLLVESQHKLSLVSSGFDGAYTYFATDGFTYGSTTRVWKELSQFYKSTKSLSGRSLLWAPSAGPGYDDTRIRPWNAGNKRSRDDGQYLRNMFTAAAESGPDYLTLTSFNEWHEGTQFEPAVPRKDKQGVAYKDYGNRSPHYYLDLTKELIQSKFA